MRCQLVIDRLDEYLDGILDDKEMEQFQLHLSDCKHCQALSRQIFSVQSRYAINPGTFSSARLSKAV